MHSAIILLGVLVIPLFMTVMLSTHVSTATATNTVAELNQTEATEETEETMHVYQNPIVNILANGLETRINKSGAILEITSRLPE
jgi:hypothetical protein